MANVYGIIKGTLSAPGQITGRLQGTHFIYGTLTIPSASDITRYEGPYEFTPTQEAQTVLIENELAEQNITINPIPNNYGLITYNGSTITVS